jgi:hypothetical protein
MPELTLLSPLRDITVSDWAMLPLRDLVHATYQHLEKNFLDDTAMLLWTASPEGLRAIFTSSVTQEPYSR